VNGRMSHPLKIGKWYFECKIVNDAVAAILGFGSNELLSRDVLLLEQAIGKCEHSWGFQLISRAAWCEILLNLSLLLFFFFFFFFFGCQFGMIV
jgi:hypothetical protein